MVRKINVMGLELDNYSIRESLNIIDNFLKDAALSYVQMVSMELLMMSESDENVKTALEQSDLTIIGDKAILEAADVSRMQRINETENSNFFVELLKRLHRGNHSVYILGDTQSDIDKLREFLSENFEHLHVVGDAIVDDDSSAYEKIVNDINIVLPDVVLSIISSPEQEAFLCAHGKHICAKLWYGAGSQKPVSRKSRGIRRLLRSLIGARIFHHKVNQFNNENQE